MRPWLINSSSPSSWAAKSGCAIRCIDSPPREDDGPSPARTRSIGSPSQTLEMLAAVLSFWSADMPNPPMKLPLRREQTQRGLAERCQPAIAFERRLVQTRTGISAARAPIRLGLFHLGPPIVTQHGLTFVYWAQGKRVEALLRPPDAATVSRNAKAASSAAGQGHVGVCLADKGHGA